MMNCEARVQTSVLKALPVNMITRHKPAILLISLQDGLLFKLEIITINDLINDFRLNSFNIIDNVTQKVQHYVDLVNIHAVR